MKYGFNSLIAFIIIGTILFSDSSRAEEMTVIHKPVSLESGYRTVIPTSVSGNRTNYSGTVRIYIVEPVSRWHDADGISYQYGFLDFPLITGVSLNDKDTWGETVTWNAYQAGFSGVQESNIMAIAVVFNSDFVEEDAYPPYGYWFNAYYVDAAAAATSGNQGQNVVNPDFTHTIFIEEGTDTG